MHYAPSCVGRGGGGTPAERTSTKPPRIYDNVIEVFEVISFRRILIYTAEPELRVCLVAFDCTMRFQVDWYQQKEEWKGRMRQG
jgi:hypothetical protein